MIQKETNMEVIHNRIKEFRARHNLTQEQLAKLTGVRRETIIHIEKNQYNPSLLLAFKIAKALKISIEKVFFIKGLKSNK